MSREPFRFEKLAVWHRAVDLADRIYEVTRTFPDTERFGLTSQMRRAVVSISSNIAEGSGRHANSDFARFLEIAYGSLMEVVSQTFVAQRQRFIAPAAVESVLQDADELARMLSNFRTSVLNRSPHQTPGV